MFDIVTSFLQVVVCAAFLSMIFPGKGNRGRNWIGTCLYVVVLTSIMSVYAFFEPPFFPNLIPFLIVSFLYLHLFRVGSWFMHIFMPVAFVAMVGAATLLLFSALDVFWGISALDFTENISIRLPATGILILLYVIFSSALGLLFGRKNSDQRLNLSVYAGMLVLPALVIFVLFILIDDQYDRITWFSNRLPLIVSMGLICVNVMIVLILNRMMKQQIEYTRLREEAFMAKLQLLHGEEIGAAYQQLRAWRHDYHNHVQAMVALVNMESYDELKAYLTGEAQAFSQIEDIAPTGNATLDALLSVKRGLARQKGVPIEIVAMVPEQLPFPAMEFCVMMGNLLDNAMEACEDVAAHRRFIRVSIGIDAAHMHIAVANSTDGWEMRKDDAFITRKRDGTLHGFGLKSIDRFVNAHGGFLKRVHKNNVFETNVLLPLTRIGEKQEEGKNERNLKAL